MTHPASSDHKSLNVENPQLPPPVIEDEFKLKTIISLVSYKICGKDL